LQLVEAGLGLLYALHSRMLPISGCLLLCGLLMIAGQAAARTPEELLTGALLRPSAGASASQRWSKEVIVDA
jgi:hypothetical protein